MNLSDMSMLLNMHETEETKKFFDEIRRTPDVMARSLNRIPSKIIGELRNVVVDNRLSLRSAQIAFAIVLELLKEESYRNPNGSGGVTTSNENPDSVKADSGSSIE